MSDIRREAYIKIAILTVIMLLYTLNTLEAWSNISRLESQDQFFYEQSKLLKTELFKW